MDQQGAVSELEGVYALFMQKDKYYGPAIFESFTKAREFFHVMFAVCYEH